MNDESVTHFIALLTNKKLVESDAIPKPDDLKDLMDEVSLGKDQDGYYIFTHRARSESYPTPHDIPKDKIKFISSTG